MTGECASAGLAPYDVKEEHGGSASAVNCTQRPALQFRADSAVLSLL